MPLSLHAARLEVRMNMLWQMRLQIALTDCASYLYNQKGDGSACGFTGCTCTAYAGEAPSSGALATGADGAQLLLLHSKAAQKATALHLPADALGEGTAKVCCESLASVQGVLCLNTDH